MTWPLRLLAWGLPIVGGEANELHYDFRYCKPNWWQSLLCGRLFADADLWDFNDVLHLMMGRLVRKNAVADAPGF
ncbi:hypothetical protein Nepgr_027730 [Nepenthes gracilis]|uniref:Uncharacterized protein n=1 Tax=Nepenthes gracilis TaxID=150966 RepID=A0AAD3Y1H2_NEPGR|nr:hypothetical protein Nepgr_027730 [Nepenthes gracilis]